MFRRLLTTADKQGRDFREQLRAYNSALDFASLGVNLDKELANARHGVYTFRTHGAVHHYIGQLTPREGEAPSFAHDGNMTENRNEIEAPEELLSENIQDPSPQPEEKIDSPKKKQKKNRKRGKRGGNGGDPQMTLDFKRPN